MYVCSKLVRVWWKRKHLNDCAKKILKDEHENISLNLMVPDAYQYKFKSEPNCFRIYDTIVQVHNFKQDSLTKASLNYFMYGKQSEIKGAGFRQTVWQDKLNRGQCNEWIVFFFVIYQNLNPFFFFHKMKEKKLINQILYLLYFLCMVSRKL